MLNNSLLKNILIYGGVTGASRMLPILLLPFYLSAMPIEDYGRIEVLVALFNFIIILGSLQLETAIQRYMYKVEDKLNYTYTILIATFSFSILILLLTTILSKKISFSLFDSGIESTNIRIIALCCVFYNLSSILMIYFRYSEQERIFYIITLSQVLITSVVTYLLVVVEKLANFGYVVGMFSGWLVVFLLSMTTILWSKRKFIGEIKPDLSILKLSINFALPQIPARIGSFFIQFGNRFIVLSYFGSTTVALLGLSVKFAAPIQLLYIAFTMALNPYLYKNETNDNLETKLNKILKLLLLFVLVSAVAIHYGSYWILDRYFQSGYKEVRSLIFIAILPSGLLIAKDILETGVRLSGKTKYISQAYFLSVVVTILLMLSSKTVNNVLESTLVGTIILLLATYYYSEKVYHFKYSRFVLYTLCALLIIALGNMII